MAEKTRLHVSPYARKTARELGVMLETLTGTGPNGRIVWRDVEAASKAEEKPSCDVMVGYYTTADISELLAALKTLDGALTFPVFAERAAARLNVPVRFAGNGVEGALPTLKSDEAAAMGRDFGQMVSDATGGAITVEVYAADQLTAGNQSEGIQAVIDGTTELSAHSNLIYSAFDPRLNVVSLPFLFDSVDDVDAKMDGAGGKALGEVVESKGLHLLGIGENGFRHPTNSVRPITCLADMVDTPVVRSGEIVIRPMMNLCLTADHRVVDGVMASKFLKRICELLENPYMSLADGLVCQPAGLEILSSGSESECLVTVREGKFHQVKRMLAAQGKPVTYLKRVSMNTDTVRVTIPEGYTVKQIITLLAKNGVNTEANLTQAAQTATFSYDFIDNSSNDISRLEGYLFPDTYDFYVNEKPESALRRLISNFTTKMDDDMKNLLTVCS